MYEPTYRYAIEPNGTITRARAYQTPEWADRWLWYWDADNVVAFIDRYHHGIDPVTENPDTERAIMVHLREKNGDKGASLDALARRTTGHADSRFIKVDLSYGSDLFALAWDGDPDNSWRDEIEALYHGEVYRIETWEYDPHTGEWHESDDVCDEWYGEANADDALVEMFPLTEFPADQLIDATN